MGGIAQRSLLFLLVALLSLSIIIIGSSETRGNPISGSSPEFSPGETFHIEVGDVTPGTIISWGWDSDDTLTFWIELPDGSTINDLPSLYGLKAQQSGTYELWWMNNNWFFSATVSYAVLSFYPQIHLNSPEDGSTITNKNPMIIGTCDQYASEVRISLNNVTFVDAEKQDINWLSNMTLESGLNTIFVETTYQTGYAQYYTHIEEFRIDVDTNWLYEENGETKLGIGIYATIMALVIVIALVGLMMWKRKKKPKQK